MIFTMQFVPAICLCGPIYIHLDIPVLMLPVCWGTHHPSTQATCRSDYNINIVTMKNIYCALFVEIKTM